MLRMNYVLDVILSWFPILQSDHIRTIIKARGISWQQVSGRAGIPNTFAVFRVDAKHHLVSLAAKLAPSPDWIVGVSALELCNVNCTWRTSITLPLYPYDTGTDSGLGYTVSSSSISRVSLSGLQKNIEIFIFISSLVDNQPYHQHQSARFDQTGLVMFVRLSSAPVGKCAHLPSYDLPACVCMRRVAIPQVYINNLFVSRRQCLNNNC